MSLPQWVLLLFIFLGMVNLLRIGVFMIGSDWHDVKHHKQRKNTKSDFRPLITIIIPAHNEEKVILSAIQSVLANSYPYKEIIVANDGSTDATETLVEDFIPQNRSAAIRMMSQSNRGKAVALNNALQYTQGELVMVLDADSILAMNALEEVVTYFQDDSVVMAASNVKILPGKGSLNLAQRFEYLIGYRAKRASTAYNCEYIIGGVGSTFRKSAIEAVGYYDTDTMTEDIDLTLKVIKHGNIAQRVIYAPTVHSYTESVPSFSQLIRQRYRWKFGRLQAFLKNNRLFFNRQKHYDKRLTWLQLPFALYSELAFLLEPFLLGTILYFSIYYHDIRPLVSTYAVMSAYMALCVIAENSNNIITRIILLLWVPILYPLLIIISAAEYVASLRVLATLPKLFLGHAEARWQHVNRLGISK